MAKSQIQTIAAKLTAALIAVDMSSPDIRKLIIDACRAELKQRYPDVAYSAVVELLNRMTEFYALDNVLFGTPVYSRAKGSPTINKLRFHEAVHAIQRFGGYDGNRSEIARNLAQGFVLHTNLRQYCIDASKLVSNPDYL